MAKNTEICLKQWVGLREPTFLLMREWHKHSYCIILKWDVTKKIDYFAFPSTYLDRYISQNHRKCDCIWINVVLILFLLYPIPLINIIISPF